MYVQVDSEAYVHNMMEAILNYKKDISAVDKADMYITTKSSHCCIQNNIGMEVIGSMEERN